MPLATRAIARCRRRREHELAELSAGHARTASSMSMTPSSTSWTAMRKAAAAVRLPTRVCSIHSLPFSIVNSMSQRSR